MVGLARLALRLLMTHSRVRPDVREPLGRVAEDLLRSVDGVLGEFMGDPDMGAGRNERDSAVFATDLGAHDELLGPWA